MPFYKRRNYWVRRWLDFGQDRTIYLRTIYLVFAMTFLNFMTIQCQRLGQVYLFSRFMYLSRSTNRLKSLNVTIILRVTLVAPVFFNSVSTCLMAYVAL